MTTTDGESKKYERYADGLFFRGWFIRPTERGWWTAQHRDWEGPSDTDVDRHVTCHDIQEAVNHVNEYENANRDTSKAVESSTAASTERHYHVSYHTSLGWRLHCNGKPFNLSGGAPDHLRQIAYLLNNAAQLQSFAADERFISVSTDRLTYRGWVIVQNPQGCFEATTSDSGLTIVSTTLQGIVYSIDTYQESQ